MLGGFEIATNDCIINSLDAHQNMATQVLSQDKVREHEQIFSKVF